MNSSYMIIFILFLILYIEHRNQKNWMKQYIQKKKGRGNAEMLELAKRKEEIGDTGLIMGSAE